MFFACIIKAFDVVFIINMLKICYNCDLVDLLNNDIDKKHIACSVTYDI
jgi:hypothetical protein